MMESREPTSPAPKMVTFLDIKIRFSQKVEGENTDNWGRQVTKYHADMLMTFVILTTWIRKHPKKTDFRITEYYDLCPKRVCMPAIFYEHEARSGLKQKRKLSAYIDGLVSRYKKEVVSCSFSFIFCTDEFMLEMNQNFLDHDTYTDIITFDLSETKEAMQGEIYISIPRVKENAVIFKTRYADELHRVIFHGILHLCGFKDKKPKDQKIMRENEDYCLEHYKKELEK